MPPADEEHAEAGMQLTEGSSAGVCAAAIAPAPAPATRGSPGSSATSGSEAQVPFKNTAMAGLYKSLVHRHRTQAQANGAGQLAPVTSASSDTVSAPTDVELGTPVEELNGLYVVGGGTTVLDAATVANVRAAKVVPVLGGGAAGGEACDAKGLQLGGKEGAATAAGADDPAGKARAKAPRSRIRRAWRSTAMYCRVSGEG